jgi:hypothetical protein
MIGAVFGSVFNTSCRVSDRLEISGEPSAEHADGFGFQRHQIGAVTRRDAAERIAPAQKFRRRA